MYLSLAFLGLYTILTYYFSHSSSRITAKCVVIYIPLNETEENAVFSTVKCKILCHNQVYLCLIIVGCHNQNHLHIPNGVSFTVAIVQNLAMIVPEIALFFDSALYYTASFSVSRDIQMRKPVKFIWFKLHPGPAWAQSVP